MPRPWGVKCPQMVHKLRLNVVYRGRRLAEEREDNCMLRFICP